MSETETARIGLPYLAAGQMQKHLTVNEALTRLDALVHMQVRSRSTPDQPEVAMDGCMFILPAEATGTAWAGLLEGTVVRAEAGDWRVVEIPDGQIAFVEDNGELLLRNAGAWVDLGGRLGVVEDLARLGVGMAADAENPFSARLNQALWTALGGAEGGNGDLRIAFNKETALNTLGLLFQCGSSARAEISLVGSDSLRVRVSPDGSTWRDAWAVDCATGRVSFDQGAQRRVVTGMTASGSYAVPAWARTIEIVCIGGGGGGGAGAFGASGARFGGGGGGAGGVNRGVWTSGELGSSLAIAVGVGGTGGLAVPGAPGSGSAIYAGAISILIAPGGGGGGVGSASAGVAGVGGAGIPNSNGGGASSVVAAGSAGKSFDRPDAPGGGGAGGGLDASGAARGGGAGGDGGALAVKASGGAGGLGAVGAAGSAAPHANLYWAGGGGGGGGAAPAGTGYDGGQGGVAGGGGGGGGAGVSAGGGGGAGASGLVWIIATG